MALANPKNGNITLPSGAGVFQSFTLDESQDVENVSSYGTNNGSYGAFLGSGTPVQNVTVNGFVQSGAFNPGMGTMTSAGASCTVTIDTSCTCAGLYIMAGLSISHARTRGAVGCTWRLQNAGSNTTSFA
jgi:hypothetical protein